MVILFLKSTLAQLWKQLDNRTLINNSTKWKYQRKKWILPNEGEENIIKEVGSLKVLGIRKYPNGDPARAIKLERSEQTRLQLWQRSAANLEGWFTLKNSELGGLLTAETDRKTKVFGNYLSSL